MVDQVRLFFSGCLPALSFTILINGVGLQVHSLKFQFFLRPFSFPKCVCNNRLTHT